MEMKNIEGKIVSVLITSSNQNNLFGVKKYKSKYKNSLIEKFVLKKINLD